MTWEVSKATSVSIGPSVGPVSTLGNVRVSPETSTTYTLTAANSQGTVTAIATVMVEKPHSTLAPVVLDFSANPRMISENDSCTLTWNIYGADSVNISLGSGKTKVTISDKLTPTGTMTVFPLYTLTASEIKAIPTVTTVPSTSVYTLTATNIAGTTTLTTDVTVLRTAILPKPGIPLAQDNITVVAATALPMIRWLSSNPITVVQGNPAILSWEVAQATKVLLNGVQVPFSGSQVINPATAATYTITANNDYWGYSKGLTVGVLAYNAQWFKPLVR